MSHEPSSSLLQTVLAAFLAGGLVLVHSGPAVQTRPVHASVAEVKPLLMARFVRELDPRELEYAALRGLVSALHDPHSSFMPPDEAESFYESTDSEFGGLGMHIRVQDGLVVVIAPLEGTPAFDAGILPGDRIIEIDGQAYSFASADEAARRLKGEPGSRVRLTVLHHGATRPEEVELERAVIKVRSVQRPVLEDEANRIGYIRITNFSKTTADELAEVLKELDAKGGRAVVLDLRQNPGGYLKAAVDSADLFIEEGIILETRGRTSRSLYNATKAGTRPPMPMAVLVNGASASASEIVAGALQDAGLATIVGSRSYGKGSVQQVKRLDDGSALRFTTDYFYTRSGRRIHRVEGAGPDEPWGIMPDIEADLDAASLYRILLARTARHFQNGSAPPDGVVEAEVPVDTQLEAALEHLRKTLAEGG